MRSLLTLIVFLNVVSHSQAASIKTLIKCKVDKATTIQITTSNGSQPLLTELKNGKPLHTTQLIAGKSYGEILGQVSSKDDFTLNILKTKKISPNKVTLVRVAHIDDLGTQLISYHDRSAKQLVAVTVFPSIEPEPSYCL